MHLTTSVCRCVQGERYLLSASCLRGSSVAQAEGFQVAAAGVGGGGVGGGEGEGPPKGNPAAESRSPSRFNN